MFYSVLAGQPFEINVETGDEADSRVVIVALARDHKSRVVSVVSELVETEIAGETQWEFSFSIDVFALDDSSEPFRTQDRNIAAQYLPSDVRVSVMDIVCRSLAALIGEAEPTKVYWVTKDASIPEKALTKYYMLREVMENIGYSCLEDGTDKFGRRFWSMGRNVR